MINSEKRKKIVVYAKKRKEIVYINSKKRVVFVKPKSKVRFRYPKKEKSEVEVKDIAGLKVLFDNNVYEVLKRKNELNKKPPYYLFDIEKKVFLSSLYYTGKKNTYLFDVRDTGKRYLIQFRDDGYDIEEIE